MVREWSISEHGPKTQATHCLLCGMYRVLHSETLLSYTSTTLKRLSMKYSEWQMTYFSVKGSSLTIKQSGTDTSVYKWLCDEWHEKHPHSGWLAHSSQQELSVRRLTTSARPHRPTGTARARLQSAAAPVHCFNNSWAELLDAKCLGLFLKQKWQ